MGYDIAEKLLSNGFQMVAREKFSGAWQKSILFWQSTNKTVEINR